jgi:hypothetical protein
VEHNATVVVNSYKNARSTLSTLAPVVDSLLRPASSATP